MTIIKRFILFLGILLMFSSCEKIDGLTQFEMKYKQSVVIPQFTPSAFPYSITTPEIETNAESNFSSFNTNSDLVEKIALNALDMTLTAPGGGDLGFLSAISIKISAEGLPEIEIASIQDIPSDVGQVVKLQATGDDLKDYIKELTFKLQLNVELDESPTVDQEIDLDTKFFVDAKILGQ